VAHRQAVFAFGWRLPFLASAVLVFLGLYVRLTIRGDSRVQESLQRREQVKVPNAGGLFVIITRRFLAGILVCLATFVLFYLMTVFRAGLGPRARLGYSRRENSADAMFTISFFALTIPLSAFWQERAGGAPCCGITASIFQSAVLIMAPMGRLPGPGGGCDNGAGSALMGLTYGPLRHGAFRTLFRHRWLHRAAPLSFNFAGILGASARAVHRQYLAKNPRSGSTSATTSPTYGGSFIGLLLIGGNEKTRTWLSQRFDFQHASRKDCSRQSRNWQGAEELTSVTPSLVFGVFSQLFLRDVDLLRQFR